MPFFLLLFIGVPLIEIALFIQVGGQLGVFNTVALVVLTAIIGVALLRWQGLETLTRARARMERGQMPAREMAEGLMLLVAGALLLTPGFFTDALGFLLLIPHLRYGLFAWLGPRFVVQRFYTRQRRDDTAHTFDGEFYRTDQPEKDPSRLDKK